MRPARTPKESSCATGFWFSSWRSGSSIESVISSDSSSSCSPSPFGGSRSDQLLTIFIPSATSQVLPWEMSLRTTTSRLTRKTIWASAGISGMRSAVSRASSSQFRW